jgi:3-methyladenine DNA glycosylase AlkD
MMDAAQVLRDIQRELRAHADARYRESIKKFIKTQYTILGVSSGEFTKVTKAFVRKHPNLSAEVRIPIAKALMGGNIYEERSFGSWLVASDRDTMERVIPKELGWITDGLDNWGHVDTLGITITGIAWRDGLLDDRIVQGWLSSDNPFVRRLALVSTVPLNQKKPGDTKRTLAICRRTVDDHHDTMVKGLSWALRELIQTDRGAVERFIEDYEERLAARVKREVRNKLSTGLKTPRKSTKK